VPLLQEYLRSRAFLIAGAIYFVLSVVSTQIPLLNYLGFESSFFTALAGSFVAGFLTIRLAGPAYVRSDPAGQPFPVFRIFLSIVAAHLVLLAIPLAILSVNAIFVPNCDYAEGLAFYLLLPCVTVTFGTALGIFCTVHYRHPRWAYLLYAGATIAYALYLGYFTPAIFSYNFFYGYFPGFSYDELLPLRWSLVLFRLFTLAVTAVVLWWSTVLCRITTPGMATTEKGVALLRALATRYLPVTLLLIAAAAVVFAFRCPLGWESTTGYVQKTLGGRVETENFTIYFDSTSTSSDDLHSLIDEHEFRLHQVLDAFALHHTDHISTYIYPSSASKRRLIGAGETELAKPWSNEVHITRSSVEAALKHELVHVVAAPFGIRVLHASLSPGLTEGLAMAVDGFWGYRTLSGYAAAIRAAGIAPPIRGLMNASGFMTNSSATSYVLSGAFCRYLIDRYGMRPLLQVYNSGEFEAAYNMTLDSLIAGWQRSLDSVAVSEGDKQCVDVMFRRPPIFGKICARVHARRLRAAWVSLQEHRYSEARESFGWMFAEARSYDALSGLLASLFRLGDYGAVVHLYDSVVSSDRVPNRYLALALLTGDAMVMSGSAQRAESLYTAIRTAEISPGFTEAAATRLLLLSDSLSRDRFKEYFITEMSDTSRIGVLAMRHEDRGQQIARYMRGRLEMRIRRYNDASAVLRGVGTITRDSTLEAIRRVNLGDALVRSGRIQEAREWFWTSLNFDSRPFAAQMVDDRLARCDWLVNSTVSIPQR
jgi:hypothetical protein